MGREGPLRGREADEGEPGRGARLAEELEGPPCGGRPCNERANVAEARFVRVPSRVGKEV